MVKKEGRKLISRHSIEVVRPLPTVCATPPDRVRDPSRLCARPIPPISNYST